MCGCVLLARSQKGSPCRTTVSSHTAEVLSRDIEEFVLNRQLAVLDERRVEDSQESSGVRGVAGRDGEKRDRSESSRLRVRTSHVDAVFEYCHLRDGAGCRAILGSVCFMRQTTAAASTNNQAGTVARVFIFCLLSSIGELERTSSVPCISTGATHAGNGANGTLPERYNRPFRRIA